MNIKILAFLLCVATQAHAEHYQVTLNGSIDEQHTQELRDTLNKMTESDTLHLEINSSGGLAYVFEDLIGPLLASQERISCNTTIGAASAAALIWAACGTHTMAKDASVLFHMGRVSADPDGLDVYSVKVNKHTYPRQYAYGIQVMYLTGAKHLLSEAQWQAYLSGDDVFLTKD